MNISTFITLCIITGIVILAAYSMKHQKHSCNGNCGSCAGCSIENKKTAGTLYELSLIHI